MHECAACVHATICTLYACEQTVTTSVHMELPLLCITAALHLGLCGAEPPVKFGGSLPLPPTDVIQKDVIKQTVWCNLSRVAHARTHTLVIVMTIQAVAVMFMSKFDDT